MKFWTITGLLAGLVVAALVVKKCAHLKPGCASENSDERYTTDDFVTDQEL